MASRERSQDRRQRRQQLSASPQGGWSLEELLLAGDVAHNSRGAQRSRVPQPLPAALNRSPALPSESSQPWSSPTRQASFSPALDESPRADPRLVAGSHPAPLRSSPVGRDECKGPAGVSAQAASCTEPPATYQGNRPRTPVLPARTPVPSMCSPCQDSRHSPCILAHHQSPPQEEHSVPHPPWPRVPLTPARDGNLQARNKALPAAASCSV